MDSEVPIHFDTIIVSTEAIKKAQAAIADKLAALKRMDEISPETWNCVLK